MEIDYNCNWFHNGREASIPHQNLQAAQMPLLLGKKAINVINKNQFFFYNSMAKQYSKYFVFSCYVRSKIVVLTLIFGKAVKLKPETGFSFSSCNKK